jgi:hypothetical protein
LDENEELIERVGWWERNWWVIILLIGCLFVGFLVGFGMGKLMLATAI